MKFKSLTFLSLLFWLTLTCGSSFSIWLLIYQGRTDGWRGDLLIILFSAVLVFSIWHIVRAYKAASWRTLGLSLLTAAVLTYSAILTLTYYFQTFLLFMPVPGDFKNCKALAQKGYRFVEVEVGNESVRAYVSRRPDARAWLLVFHGNAESACTSYKYAAQLTDIPLNFAFAEYPGYQGDHSNLSESKYLHNALAIRQWLAQEIPTLPVFLMGRSLGTGVATYVASTSEASGLILISPYTSVEQLAPHAFPFLPARLMRIDRFQAFTWAHKVTTPTLIVHGDSDRLIPIEMGLAQSLNFTNLVEFASIKGATHNSVVSADSPAWRKIHEFLAARTENW